MIKAQRVLDVMKFLKPGEQWEVFDYGHSLRITIRGTENGIAMLEMNYLHHGADGRYVKRRFIQWDLQTHKDPVGNMAFELVNMASDLGVYK